MSSRLLSYQAEEIVFECRQACWHECGSGSGAYFNAADRATFINTLIRPLKNPAAVGWGLRVNPKFDYWHLVVIPEYSKLLLSYESDKLPALSALARIQQIRTGCRYLAGLWQETLLLGLTWREASPMGGPTNAGRAPRSYRAPSWSWTSVDGTACYNYSLFKGRSCALAYVEDAHSSPSSELNITGSVIDGSATLHGPVIQGMLNMEPHYDDVHQRLLGVQYSITFDIPGDGDSQQGVFGSQQVFFPDTPILACKQDSGHGSQEGQYFSRFKSGRPRRLKRIKGPVLCLSLYHCLPSRDAPGFRPFTVMLVLTPSPEKETIYERIGLLEVYDDSVVAEEARFKALDDWPFELLPQQRDITIV